MNELIVSIIVPIYNVELYLNECLESIINQTYTNLEIILVNDGSKDSSGIICDTYAAKDKRIKVIHKINGGLSNARNTGILESNGDYLVFIDSDDYWSNKEFIQKLIDKINFHDIKPEIVLFNFTNYFEKHKKFKVDGRNFDINLNNYSSILEKLEILVKNNIFTASACFKCFKSSFVKDNQFFFKPNIYCEDVEWTGRILLKVKYLELLNDSNYIYRRRNGSITTTIGKRNINDLLVVIGDATEVSKNITDEKLMQIYMGFFAFQYSTLLIVINSVKEREIRKSLFSELNRYSFLLKYNMDKKVKIINLLNNFIGLKNTSTILTIFYRVTNLIKQ